MVKICFGIGNVYLICKGFFGWECWMLIGIYRVGGVSWCVGDFVVLLYDDSGELVNFQLISVDGCKCILKGGQVRGICYIFEGQNQVGKCLWIVEGYVIVFIVYYLIGEMVMVVFFLVNFFFLVSFVWQKYLVCQIVFVVDCDFSGDGQKKVVVVVDVCEGVVVLLLVFGDWNDVFMQYGGEVICKVIYDVIWLLVESLFDIMSEVEFFVMSISEKVMCIYEYYGEVFVVDVNGQFLFCYENGVWKVLLLQDFVWDVVGLFQWLCVLFFFGKVVFVVDILKLIILQQEVFFCCLIGFCNGVFDMQNGMFYLYSLLYWMCILCDVDFILLVEGEMLEIYVFVFWCWFDCVVGGCVEKCDVILVVLFMVLVNCYDWQFFLEVIGFGGSGKSIMVEIVILLVGEDNVMLVIIEMLEFLCECVVLIGFLLICLLDQEKWSGDGVGFKVIIGGDVVFVDLKYWDVYFMYILVVILVVNNNLMCFIDCSGGVLCWWVIIYFLEQIVLQECDLQFKDKIICELVVIVCYLMQKFSDLMFVWLLFQFQ